MWDGTGADCSQSALILPSHTHPIEPAAQQRLGEPSKEAELPRLARLTSIPLVPEAALLSWEEAAPSNSWQTSSSVKEVDSESWAPTEERLVRSEL